MKINRLFTFDVSLIERLNDKIRRGNRSKFVNAALSEKLFGNSEVLALRDASSGRVLSELREREDVSDFLKRAIELELKSI